MFFYVNYVQEFHVKDQLIRETVYSEREPARLFHSFRIRLTIFMALTNCFHKNFKDFLRFVFISYDFCSSMT